MEPLEFRNIVKFAVSGRARATLCIDQGEVWQVQMQSCVRNCFLFADCVWMWEPQEFKIWDV